MIKPSRPNKMRKLEPKPVLAEKKKKSMVKRKK